MVHCNCLKAPTLTCCTFIAAALGRMGDRWGVPSLGQLHAYLIEVACVQMKTDLSNDIKDQTGMSNVCIEEFNCNTILRLWLLRTLSINTFSSFFRLYLTFYGLVLDYNETSNVLV